jgi:hypothetical protein
MGMTAVGKDSTFVWTVQEFRYVIALAGKEQGGKEGNDTGEAEATFGSEHDYKLSLVDG